YGRCDFVGWIECRRAPYVKKPNGHQCTYTAHLSLVFIMPTITVVGRDGSIGTFFYLPYPILCKPWFPRPTEDVGIRATRLVRITNVALAVAENKILLCGLLKSMV